MRFSIDNAEDPSIVSLQHNHSRETLTLGKTCNMQTLKLK